ncbi:hypothetical protein [Massilia sp. BKSP1R2A-1]|uniref:hypothetical protein n=1 Tax=Massilia sp. BKSP1R2A-1 TaxID=3422595 RepID=UPI003D33DAE2
MIKTWRERLGLGEAYPLHAPTDVERAMVAEIAELRARIERLAPDEQRQLLVIGGQRLGKSALLDLQCNAARYLWLRDKADKMTGSAAPMVASLDAAGGMVALLDGDELDAAVDIAMAQRAPRAPNTKRTGTN